LFEVNTLSFVVQTALNSCPFGYRFWAPRCSYKRGFTRTLHAPKPIDMTWLSCHAQPAETVWAYDRLNCLFWCPTTKAIDVDRFRSCPGYYHNCSTPVSSACWSIAFAERSTWAYSASVSSSLAANMKYTGHSLCCRSGHSFFDLPLVRTGGSGSIYLPFHFTRPEFSIDCAQFGLQALQMIR
jgi:hypothetical protein